MKKGLLLLLLVFSFSLVNFSIAQVAKGVGGASADFGSSIVQTKDGGYALSGSTDSYGTGKDNIYVLKLDSAGKLQWTKTIASKSINYAYSIIQTRDGGYAVAGYTDSVHGAGNADVYMVKLDTKGSLKWTKTIGGTDWDIAYSVFQTKDGGYALTGSSFSFSSGSNHVYVIRIDRDGKVLWTKIIGDKENAIGCSIVQTDDGGYAITGVTYSMGEGGGDVYVIKLDPLGNVLWNKAIGGTQKDMGFSIIQTNDYGYAITGVTYSYGAGNGDVYVIKLDRTGNLKWTKTIGGPGTDQGASIIQTKDHGYVITGSTDSAASVYNFDIYVVSLDSVGNLKWTKTIGGPGNDEGSSVAQTKNGGYAVTGFSQTHSAGCYNAFLLKLDTTGTLSPASSQAKIDTGTSINSPLTNSISTNICSAIADNTKSDQSDIQVYPNPCANTLYLDFDNQPNLPKENTTIQIADITNRILITLPLTIDTKPMANDYSLDVSSLNPGIYFLHIKSGDKIEQKKFVKE